MTKEEKREYDKEYRKKNREKYKNRYTEYYKNYRDEHKKKSEKYRIQRIYGLSLESVDDILKQQDHKCAICGKSLHEGKRVIDHNHATGKVRGILCVRCNAGLWGIEDQQYFNKAIEYLKKDGYVYVG